MGEARALDTCPGPQSHPGDTVLVHPGSVSISATSLGQTTWLSPGALWFLPGAIVEEERDLQRARTNAPAEEQSMLLSSTHSQIKVGLNPMNTDRKCPEQAHTCIS